MTVAKLAYLTSPSPGRFMLNLQPFGSEELIQIEIGRDHLVNILIDGSTSALREYQYHRVPSPPTQDADNERAASGA